MAQPSTKRPVWLAEIAVVLAFVVAAARCAEDVELGVVPNPDAAGSADTSAESCDAGACDGGG